MAASQPKILRKQLVSTSVYPVNNSASKFLLVGYDVVKDRLVPVVKLSGTKGPGPTLTVQAWRKLCDSFETITDYLEGGAAKVSPISLHNEQIVLFNTAYSQRSILIDNIQKEDEEPPTKKLKPLYTTGIVLQLTSVKGLIKVSEAVNYRLEGLTKNKEAVDCCFDTLIEYMKTEAFGEHQTDDGKIDIAYATANLNRALESGFAHYCELVYKEVKDSHPNFGENKCFTLTAELLSLCYDFLFDIATRDE